MRVRAEKKFRNGMGYWEATASDDFGRVGKGEHVDLEEAQLIAIRNLYSKIYRKPLTEVRR